VTRTLAPSELGPHLGQASAGTLARVGGRVVGRSGTSLLLADAWVTIVIEAESWPTDWQPGHLVELEVSRAAAGYRLEGVHGAALGREGPEVRRLGPTGRAHALLGRDRARRAVRRYFEEQQFLEVETPTFVPCPGLDAHVHALAAVERGARRDYLITSPELHMKRLLVGGLPRIFQLARVFRAEELGRHHQPEFSLLEWYRAYSGVDDMLNDTEELVCRVAEAVTGKLELCVDGRRLPLTRPFLRHRVDAAFVEFAGVDDVTALIASDEARYFELLVSAVEPGLARLERPVFLTHYPSAHAALARRDPNDPRFAERFELYAGGVELCNGFGELTDGAEQRTRFEQERTRRAAADEPVYPVDERFLAALEEGMPHASGNALGFDRLVALAAGVDDIALTMAFPDQDR